MVASQARRFAAAGYSCSVLDYFGTGESEGELADASLDEWFGNVVTVVKARLDEVEAPVSLWGVDSEVYSRLILRLALIFL